MDETFLSHIAKLRDAALDYLGEQSKGRSRAQDYYRGDMPDLPASAGRSSVVSMDVRAIIRKVMPSITRTILSNDQIVEYEPIGPEDEAGAKQATEYVNHVVVPECGAEQSIHDAIHDALLVKTGILKWHAYQRRKATVTRYTDQADEQVIGLLDDPENEILDHKKEPETDPGLLQLAPDAMRHSFRLKRVVDETCIRLDAVPRERFLITPGADSIEDAELVGEEQRVRRCDLVSMGYDKGAVWRLKDDAEDDDTDRQARMGDDWTGERAESQKALREVLIWELYVRHDEDDDGIAELHRVVFGEGEAEDQEARFVELGHEVVDEAPYAEVVVERDAHQFEGHSTFEDTEDVQQVKTALIRQTLDNLYASNNPRPVVDYSAVVNPDDVARTEFGLPIVLKGGRAPDESVKWQSVPFFAEKSFGMLEYWDRIARERTGITDASAGLEAEHIQNVNTGVAALLSEGGVAQADAIVRSIARGGLKKAFRGLLKLVIAHADAPRTVRIRGEWQQYDPRVWNVDMDCRINVGLGGGTRERDLAVLQLILGLQKDVLMSMGPQVGQMFVSAEQLGTTLQKIVETAGFPSADPFFSKPDPQQVQEAVAQASQGSDPEKTKAETALQIEQMKQETNRQRETAQMEADLTVKQAEIAAEDRRWAQELALKREEMAVQERLEMQKMVADMEKARIGAEASLAAAKETARRGGLNG